MSEQKKTLGGLLGLRMLSQIASTLMNRGRYANVDGKMYGGDRDLYTALGYDAVITEIMYRSKYRRNAVAGRVVDTFPMDTWRGGFELVEDQDAATETKFETEWRALSQRFNIPNVFKRCDQLAGIGRYGVIMIGAPGELETPLEKVSGPDEIAYLSVYAEEDATISEWDNDRSSPRFGLPAFYTIKRTTLSSRSAVNAVTDAGRKVHWTRVHHMADGCLDDNVYGTPRLERVWNLLLDLSKVTGGGAEAFWRRADGGTHVDIDPTINFGPEELDELKESMEDFTHDFKKTLYTRGARVQRMGSDVAPIKDTAMAIIEQISAGTGIPARVLMGSEQGKLAAEQDSVKYYRLVEDRRADYAVPQVVSFVARLIALGALSEPKEFEVRFRDMRTRNDDDKATYAQKLAQVNSTQGETVVTTDEIRDMALGLDPLKEQNGGRKPEAEARTAAQRKGQPSWKAIHRAADRFPRAVQASGTRSVRGR